MERLHFYPARELRNELYREHADKVYATWTPTNGDNIVWAGIQPFVRNLNKYFEKYFFNIPWYELKYIVPNLHTHIYIKDMFKKLHKLGYLPIEIKSLPEGSIVKAGTPCCTITNTHPGFSWLVAYIKKMFELYMWLPSTSATYYYNLSQVIKRFNGRCDNVILDINSLSSVDAANAVQLGFDFCFDDCYSLSSDFMKENYTSNDNEFNDQLSFMSFLFNIKKEDLWDKKFWEEFTKQHDTNCYNFYCDTNDTERFLCGVAPQWKEYDSKDDFESYYKRSELMRDLYCNEVDADIYLNINGSKYVVKWESKNDIDIFNYRFATYEERGALDVSNEFYNKFSEETEDGIKTAITFYVKDEGRLKEISNHIKNLGFDIKSVVFISDAGYIHNKNILNFKFEETYVSTTENGNEVSIKTNSSNVKGIVKVKKNNDNFEVISGYTEFTYTDNGDILQPVFSNGEIIRIDTLEDIRERLHNEK